MTSKARLIAILALIGGVTSTLAQDNAPPRPAPSPPAEAEEPAETPPAADRPDAADDEFIPTEELNPDAAVTFPVDI